MLRNATCYAVLFFIAGMTSTMANAAETAKEFVTSLGSIPEGYEIINESLKYSPDFNHVSYVVNGNQKNLVRLDDKTSPPYIAVRPGFPVFSPKTNRNAYMAYTAVDKAVCVVDWQAGPEFDNMDQFLFSSDGARFAYRAARDGKQCVVVDGKPGPMFDGIPVKNNMEFRPDASRFAYVALTENGCALILDGKQQPGHYNFIEGVTFSPDSTQLAFKARIEKTGNTEKWHVVQKNQAGPVYDKIFDLVFSPDSRHFGYTAVKNKKMVLVLDGVEMQPRDLYGFPVYSPDSKSVFYVYIDKQKYHFVINGKEQDSTFDKFYRFYSSPNSQNYAYIANNDQKWHCVYNGKIGPGYKIIDGFKFSPDSSRYAYGAVGEDGGKVIVNGKPGQRYLAVGEPYFSPDSRHIAYRADVAEKLKWTTVLDGNQFGDYYVTIGKYFFSDDSKHLAYSAMKNPKDIVMVVDKQVQCPEQKFIIIGDPYFSPGGTHVAYHAMIEEERWKLVVDGRVLENEYGGFIRTTPIVWNGENEFHTLAIRLPGPEFVRINVKIPAGWKIETEI